MLDEKGSYTFVPEENTIIYYFKKAEKNISVRHVTIPENKVLREEQFDLKVNQSKEFSSGDFEGYELSYIKFNEEKLFNKDSIKVNITRESSNIIEFGYIKNIITFRSTRSKS